jgi:hypothetical protein
MAMKELILLLRNKKELLPEKYFFNPPASKTEIEFFQREMGIILNENVRQFYLIFNGGFIALGSWESKFLYDNAMIETMKWNSNYFLSLSEIVESYYNCGTYSSPHLPEKEALHGRKLIPLIHTSGQEMLVLDATDPATSGPVLDAFHEEPYDEWGKVYETFEALVKDYIEKEGNIKTIGS